MFCQLALCATICLLLFCTWTYDYWKKRGVPYAKPLPLFGSFFDVITFRKPLKDVIGELYRSGDGLPFLGYYQFRSPGLLVRDPALVKKVLVTDFDSFSDPTIFADTSLDPLLARIPFLLTGDMWKAVRSLLAPAFSTSKVRSLYPVMNLVSKELLDHLQRHTPGGVNIKDLMSRFTTDMVVRCGFGVCGNSFSETENTLRKLGELLIPGGILRTIQLLIFTLIPTLPKFLRPRLMDLDGQNFFRQVIRELMSYRESNRVFRNDYLQMLMQIKYRRNATKDEKTINVAGIDIEYTDEDIAAHAMLLFFVGSEFPAYVLGFVLYELARNPDIQIRLRAEVDSILSKHKGGLTYETVKEMTYLDMVLNECMRMHPPFESISRQCTKAFELQVPGGGTCILEEGTTVLVPTEAIQMDPQYFPEPHKFEPERFSHERKGDIKPFTFLPFGSGPRQCIGINFVMAMMKIGLVAMISQFEIYTTPKTPKSITYDPFSPMLDIKEEIWLDFVQRK